LAVSLATCAFILLWAQDEKSYDRFHKDPGRIYQAIAHFKGEGRDQSTEHAPGLFAATAEQDFPEVETYCRIDATKAKSLKTENANLKQKEILYVDSTFFSFFNFPVVKSPTRQLLQTSGDAIISESLALELFGDQDPTGKAISINEDHIVYVAAVMKDMPDNTSIPHADIICSLGISPITGYGFLNSWSSCEYQTYLRLKPDSDVDKLAKEITVKQTYFQDTRYFTLQPLIDRHLYSFDGTPNSILKTVRILQWIALAILCIACINYINLIMARASKRQQEIGLRKTLGAGKKQLFLQLMREACMMFLFALFAAILLNLILLPGYNQLSGKEFSILQWNNKNTWEIYGIMSLAIILSAGWYPAWMLASFKPAKKIQEKRQGGFLRKSLVTLQFASSVVLIVLTITMLSQMNYIRKKDLGFDREHVFTCKMGPGIRYDVVRNELLKNSAVHEVSCGGEDIVDTNDNHIVSDWQGRIGDKKFTHGRMWVDSTFFQTMRMSFVEGESFTNNGEEQFVINETTAKAMGMEKPVVGKWMTASGGIRGTIVGVVKDFNFKNLHKEIEPVVIRQNSVGKIYVRTTAKEASKAIAAVEKLWKQYSTGETFTYSFLDDTFNRMYQSDVRFGQLFGIFSLIAIFISCLGLFGLVTYIAETKTKEIGIRKVLGASVGNIINMLSKEFLILVCIAMLTAFPLSYYWAGKLLQDYAYRISIDWWIFALAGLITIIYTIITVGRQALKAATANPVNAIKTE
jgi:ABC-type antimicrobial peptide transport system permease subunit